MYGLVGIVVTISPKWREPRVEGGNPGRGGNYMGLGVLTGTFKVLCLVVPPWALRSPRPVRFAHRRPRPCDFP